MMAHAKKCIAIHCQQEALLHIEGVQNQAAAAREKWQHREKKSRNWSSSWCLILDDGVVSSHPKPLESLDHQARSGIKRNYSLCCV